MAVTLPDRPPFVLRARVLTPLAAGGTRSRPTAASTLTRPGGSRAVGPWTDAEAAGGGPHAAVDLRPLVLLPGMIDLHVHFPQLPNAGVGAGLDLLTWLRALHLPARAGVRRGGRRAPGAARLTGVCGRRHDHRRDVRGGVRVVARCRVPGRGGTRNQGRVGKVMMDRGATTTPSRGPRPRNEPPPVGATYAPAGTCGTTAGSGTRSRRGSPSRAGRTCSAGRRELGR